MNDKTKLIVRILCLIMALLMILGVVVSLVQSFLLSVRAEETAAAEDDLLFRVGLLFGDDAPVSYTISAENGFSLGYSDKETNSFTSVLTVASPKIAAARPLPRSWEPVALTRIAGTCSSIQFTA